MWLWCAVQCFRVDLFVQEIYRVVLTNPNRTRHHKCKFAATQKLQTWPFIPLKRFGFVSVIVNSWNRKLWLKIARAVFVWFISLSYILFCICFRLLKFVRVLVFFFLFLLNTGTWQCAQKCQRLKLFMFAPFNCQVHWPWHCDVT